MKITFTVSKLIDIEPWNIIPKINSRLIESGYNITSKNDNTISFNNSFWKIGSRSKAFGKVDGGKFQIITSGTESKLIVTYYFSFVPIIFFAVFFIFLAIVISDYHILYFLLIFLIINLLRIDNVKSVGRQMINEILL